MVASANPYGLVPISHAGGGLVRTVAFSNGITSGYSSNIYLNSPVKLVTAGVINIAAATDAIIGSFAGVEYTDAAGRRKESANWVASTTGTDITAYVYIDPQIIYKIQSAAAVALTARGDEADFAVSTTGNNTTGLSNASISGTLAGAGNQGVLRIIDIFPGAGNAFGDTYVDLQVMIAKHQFLNPQTAI